MEGWTWSRCKDRCLIRQSMEESGQWWTAMDACRLTGGGGGGGVL